MKLYNLRVVSPLSLLKAKGVVGELKKKGKSKGKPDSAYDAEQLKMGVKVEMEHGLGEDAAKEIAKDHLEEIPDYYSRLDKMESAAKKSLSDSLEKGRRVPIGTVSGQYKKIAEGDWRKVPVKGTKESEDWDYIAPKSFAHGDAVRIITERGNVKGKITGGGENDVYDVTVTGGRTHKIHKHYLFPEKNIKTEAGMYHSTSKEKASQYVSSGVATKKDWLEPQNPNDKDKFKFLINLRENLLSGKTKETKDYSLSSVESELDRIAKRIGSHLQKGEKAVAEATKHPDKPGAGAKKRKKLKNKDDKVHAVMKEFKEGTLHSSSGEKVTSRDQAIAIAMSESGQSKKSVEEYLDVLEKATSSKDFENKKKDPPPKKGAKKKNLKAQAQQREKARFNRQQRKEAGYDVSAEKSMKVGLFMSKGKKMPVGTVAVWGSRKYRKVSEGMWKPVPVGNPKSRSPAAVSYPWTQGHDAGKRPILYNQETGDIKYPSQSPKPSREKRNVPIQGEFPKKTSIPKQGNTGIKKTKLYRAVVAKLGQYGIAGREKHAVKIIRLAAEKRIKVSQAIDEYIKNTSDKKLY